MGAVPRPQLLHWGLQHTNLEELHAKAEHIRQHGGGEGDVEGSAAGRGPAVLSAAGNVGEASAVPGLPSPDGTAAPKRASPITPERRAELDELGRIMMPDMVAEMQQMLKDPKTMEEVQKLVADPEFKKKIENFQQSDNFEGAKQMFGKLMADPNAPQKPAAPPVTPPMPQTPQMPQIPPGGGGMGSGGQYGFDDPITRALAMGSGRYGAQYAQGGGYGGR